MNRTFARPGRILTVLDVHEPDGSTHFYAVDIYRPDVFSMTADFCDDWRYGYSPFERLGVSEMILRLEASSQPGGFRYVVAPTLEQALRHLADMAAEEPERARAAAEALAEPPRALSDGS